MANTTTSPNMNLPVPVVGTDPGPDWATNLNACMAAIDSHNHTSGQGVQLSTASISGLVGTSYSPSVTWTYVSGGTATISNTSVTAYYLQIGSGVGGVVWATVYVSLTLASYSGSSGAYSFVATSPVSTTTLYPAGSAVAVLPSSQQSFPQPLVAYISTTSVTTNTSFTVTGNGTGYLLLNYAYIIN